METLVIIISCVVVILSCAVISLFGQFREMTMYIERVEHKEEMTHKILMEYIKEGNSQ